jgi:hypothetical protein
LKSITIPNSVTSIGSYAFSRCSGLKSITIPNSVTSIWDYAFADCNLKSATIGTGVLAIGSGVFYNNQPAKVIWLTNTPPSGYSNAAGTINYVANDLYTSLSNKTVYKYLSSLFVVDGVKYVPVSPSERTCDAIDCLYDENAENIHIGETVTNEGITLKVNRLHPYACYSNQFVKEVQLDIKGDVGDDAFYNCDNITTATITNAGNIGGNCFYSCDALTTATIANTGGIFNSAFLSCAALQTATLGEKVTGIGQYAFDGCLKLESIVIPNSVTTIGQYAFQNCSSMTSVKMGNGVGVINAYTFSGCSKLTDMQIGTKVGTISTYAFNNCTSLPKITIPQSVTKINNYVFYGCTQLKDIYIADRNTILTLGSNGSSPLFSSCPLDSAYIGGNISYNTSSSYGYSPFYRNTSLRSVTITDEETEISENEFYGCTNLKNVSIGDGVTTIGKWAFSGCSSLDYFAFGSSVTSIGQEAFSDCTAMTKLISHAATPPTCGSQALEDINIWTCKLEVPTGNKAAYAVADQWKEFLFVNEGDGTNQSYRITYIVDGETYKIVSVAYGAAITPEPAPVKDGYTFSGWSELPETMPAQNLTVTGTFALDQQNSVTVTAKSYTVQYGDPIPALGYTTTGAALNGTPKLTCEATQTSPVGTYVITASRGTVTNENDAYINGTLTIVKAPLTIKAGSYTKTQGEDNPTFTLTYEGFKNGETAAVLIRPAVASTLATKTSEPGQYRVTVSGAESDNYDITYVNGMLTVTAALVNPDTDDVLVVSDLSASLGATVMMPVSMENTDEITAFQFELEVPAGVTVTSRKLSTRKSDDHSLGFAQLPNGNYQFTAFSSNSTVFSGNSGTLVDVGLTIDGTMTTGQYAVKVKNIVLTTPNGVQKRPADITANLTVSNVKLGDVNGDGTINITDAVGVVNYILGRPGTDFKVLAADVNKDGTVNITDAVGIVNHILGRNVLASRSMTNGPLQTSGGAVSVNAVSIPKGGTGLLDITLTNSEELSSYQMALTLPQGVTVSRMIKGSRFTEDEHLVSWNQKSDGTVMLTCLSTNGVPFTGNDGVLVSLELTAQESLSVGSQLEGQLTGVTFVTPGGVQRDFDNVDINITIAETARVILDETSTTAPEDANGVDVRVKRTINAGEWSTICLPFAMSQAQCQAAFGSDVQIGDFTGYTYNSGEDKITVNFSSVTAIAANRPYIIKVSTAVTEFTVDGVDVNPADDPRVSFRTSNKKLKDFVGTYVADFDFYDEAKHTPLFLSGNQFWYATESTKHMKAFRAYFDFVDMLSEVDAARVAIAFDEVTVINDVRTCSDDRYYNLSGQQVKAPAKGVFVKNGKKVIVK